MTTVEWTENGGPSRFAAVDPEAVWKATYDGQSEGATAAAMLVRQTLGATPEGSPWASGEGPTVEILSPQEYAGLYRVSVSWTVRKGVQRCGTHARSVERRTPASDIEAGNAAAVLMPPESVEEMYVLLGNRYGHEIHGLPGTDGPEGLEALREGYDRGLLHDRGWPVYSKAHACAGFLADTTHWNGDPQPSPEALDRFRRDTGTVPQQVSRWGGEDVSFTVAFVPIGMIQEAPVIIDALEDMAREAAAKTAKP